MDNSIKLDFLSQEDLIEAGCFDLDMAISIAKKALCDYQQGKFLFPEKIVQIFDEETQSRINCLPATLLDDKICGMKWVSVFPQNPLKFRKQNLSAIILLSEIETGFPIAIMEGTLCSNMRVGAIGAIAAEYLARQDSETIGFIGAGEQAKMHLLAMKLVRPKLKKCMVAAKFEFEEKKFVDEMSKILQDIEFVKCNTKLADAIIDSDIIVTATSVQAPLLKAEWIKEGTFYSHIGGWEDEYAVAKKASKIVCDEWNTVKHRSQTISRMYKSKELSDEDIYTDLHELVMGTKQGRENDKEFIYFNAVGLSYVDINIAYEMYKIALSKEYGTQLYMQKNKIFDRSGLLKHIKIIR